MIDAVEKDMKRWAAWVLEPTAGISLGYGTNICQRIVEGKGQIMPGSAGGVRLVRSDLVAQAVEEWMKGLERSQKFTLKLFYLSTNMTVEEKAQRMKISRRALYDRVEKLHHLYQQWLVDRGGHK